MRWSPLRRLGVWWVVAVGAASGVALVSFSLLRTGGYVFGASFIAAALLRLTLPAPRGGGLEVRGRLADVVILLVLGAAAVVAFALVKL